MWSWGLLLGEAGLAAGIPIGIPLGIPIGIAVGSGSAEKKFKAKLTSALATGKIQVLDEAGNPLLAESLFEILASKD